MGRRSIKIEERTDVNLQALHRSVGSAKRSGNRSGSRAQKFNRRAARDQRKRLADLNSESGSKQQKKRRRRDLERAGGLLNPKEWPFCRCFWVDPPAPALGWRQQVCGPERETSLKALRKSMSIVVRGDCPPPIADTEDSQLPRAFAEYFAASGLTQPSRVQQQCWPAALTGADVLGIAPTGSGKTLAYLLPSVPHVQAQLREHGKLLATEGPILLVLVPTRELALQVATTARAFEKLFSLQTLALYGGGREGKDEQLEALYRTHHLLVSTPGRLVQLLAVHAVGRRFVVLAHGGFDWDLPIVLGVVGTKVRTRLPEQVTLQRVTMLAIDEADRMMDLGFEEQLDTISTHIRPDRQTLLYSATFPARLRAAAKRWLGERNYLASLDEPHRRCAG
jgi:ATP-dependent RNA helicase DDX5/DBP2